MYFGLHFYYSSIDIMISNGRSTPSVLRIPELEEYEKGKEFIRWIKGDVLTLKQYKVAGEKMEWKHGGYCRLLQGTNDVYVYHHPSHASCSKVKFSHIEPVLFFESETEHKLLEKEIAIHSCDHTNHYRLQPFFLDNYRLIEYYNNMQTNDDEATQLLTELNAVEDGFEKGEMMKDSEFNRPGGLVNNWDEDHWTRRLHIGIKKTFKVETCCGAEKMEFDEVLIFLKVRSFLDKDCFMFRGLPDIIIHRKGLVLSAGASVSDVSDSSEEESTVENTWQRPILKGYDDISPAEKLGELLSGLYILLVAKIMRKVYKKREFRRKFQVKGVMLNKAAQTVLCTLSVDLTRSGAQLSVILRDYMGTLDSKLLCYLIRALTIEDS